MRRDRAKAQRGWYLHRTGVRPLGAKTLKQVHKILSRHHSKDHIFLQKISNAMADMDEAYPWHCGTCHRLNKKVHTTCPKCHAHWSYGTRHCTEPKTVPAYQSSGYRDIWEPWDQDWKQGEKDQSWSNQRPHSASRPRTKSPRNRKGKSKASEAKGKEGKGIGDSFATASTFGPLAPSAPPWPAPETAASSSHPFPSANALVQSAQDVAAMAQALKEAYPDEGTRPQNVKDMIEKAERDAVLRYQSAQQSPKNACRESRSQAAAPTGFCPIVAKATGRSEKLHA